MRKLTVTILIATLLALFYSAHHTLAQQYPLATFTVTSTADAVDAALGDGICATTDSVCTLRAAIQEANALAGDDTIILPAGTYTLTLTGANEDAAATGDLDFTSNVTLNGAGAATTINGNWVDRVLHITGAFTVHLSGITITHGNSAGGGIRNDGGALTLTDSAISDNNSGSHAGGILNSGDLTITNSTFDSNNAGSDAGGIFSSGRLTITNSTFSDNNAGDGGGAIFSSGALTVGGSTFSTNNASNGGGVFTGGGTATMTSSTFSSNSAWAGGGLYDDGGVITITTSTFSDNTASTGGGVYTQFDVVIANSTFSNNDGNDIYTNSGALIIINSTIFGYISDPDRVSATGSSRVDGSGSGVYNDGGAITLQNSIVASHEDGGNCVGVIINGGHNLDDGGTCGWGSANGSLTNTDPMLGISNGSPAYFPLNVGSPAMDAGDNAICAAAPVSNNSQNSITRPTDGDGSGTATCDIGAFERSSGFSVYLPYIVK